MQRKSSKEREIASRVAVHAKDWHAIGIHSNGGSKKGRSTGRQTSEAEKPCQEREKRERRGAQIEVGGGASTRWRRASRQPHLQIGLHLVHQLVERARELLLPLQVVALRRRGEHDTSAPPTRVQVKR
eukprot:6200762-Pleurochrysis_carterae.AAC.2